MDAAGIVGTYVRMGWRKRWLLALPLLLCTAGAVVVLQYLPKVYRATTLILVQPPNIPSEYVKPTVRSEEGVRTLRQQITSRTRLEQVARDLNLFSLDNPREVEARIAGMRGRIDLQVKEEKDQIPSAFTLSYVSRDPKEAARVANRLADLFIEVNAQRRRARARDTSQFLGEELARMSERLAEQEEAIASFKKKYQAELPTQQDANLRVLEARTRDLRDNQLALERARERKALLELQLAEMTPQSAGAASRPGSENDPLDPRAELLRLRKQLDGLLLRYTDKYPEVQRLKERIATLQKAVDDLPPQEEAAPVLVPNPSYDLLRTEVQSVALEIVQLEQEAERLRQDITLYERRVENAPQREQELLALNRDYETLKENYQSLLNKKTMAQIAETLEEERQGEQFIVLDRAKAPATPFRPKPVHVISMGVLLGLGLGVGGVALLELLRPTFYSPQQIQESLGVPVIAAVPVIPQRRGRGRASADAAAILLTAGAAVELLRFLPGAGG